MNETEFAKAIQATNEEAEMSVYRFLSGAQCSDEGIQRVQTIIRFVSIVLHQEAVCNAAKKAMTDLARKVKTDEGRMAVLSSLGACGVLCEATRNYEESLKGKELN